MTRWSMTVWLIAARPGKTQLLRWTFLVFLCRWRIYICLFKIETDATCKVCVQNLYLPLCVYIYIYICIYGMYVCMCTTQTWMIMFFTCNYMYVYIYTCLFISFSFIICIFTERDVVEAPFLGCFEKVTKMHFRSLYHQMFMFYLFL